MTKGDVWAGLILAGLAIFIIQQALVLDYFSEYGLGPGFLPLWLGIVIFTLSLALIGIRILGRPEAFENEGGTSAGTGRALATWGGLMLAIALLNVLGFITSFVLLTFLLVLVMDRRSPSTSMVVAVGGALGFYLVFSAILGVPLPQGPWGF
ncbi:MAG: tripartite tricarboxylate transporter TctB family protein [Deltaproteobacteria bacterium]|nr:tripartite tricarboxylate transporter TctB family protein [Deltaproteobacteria bacterium]